jgi:hypoxanthine phosphoribosyltransferase
VNPSTPEKVESNSTHQNRDKSIQTVTDGSLQLLLSKEQLQDQICQMASEIEALSCSEPIVILGVLKGCLHFLSDLLRVLPFDVRTEYLRVSSYPDKDQPIQFPHVIPVGQLELKGATVLVVDDILDRGGTRQVVEKYLTDQGVKRIYWAFLLVKEGSITRIGFQPDFIGFTIPDQWVVGFGLDYSERYRNLEGIYRLTPSVD